jgi:exocyst complex component 2
LTEDWVPSLAEPFITHHPARIELFQRRLTTAAFKIAVGVDPSSTLSRPVNQNAIPQNFISKISKAFLDTIHGFFDGLLLLASDESPAATGKCPDTVCPSTVELDFKDGVCHHMNVYFPWEIDLMVFVLSVYPPTTRHL